MQNPIFNNLFEHWSALRNSSDVPNRCEIDPRVFPDALENTFIFERIAEDDFRARLAGLNLCEMMGMEVRGQSAASFMQHTERDRIQKILSHILIRPAIGELKLEGRDLAGKKISVNMILLPLRSDMGEVNRVIGCISYPQTSYTAPLRFAITSQKLTPLSALGTSREEIAVGFSEKIEPFRPQGFRAVSKNDHPLPSQKRHGHLKLVQDED
ncbi:MAG: PAS domain-containing protein [Rhodobacteraceae bacterium]|nr:PAS domain-containing protein [Paracoccaceae bacterium]